MRRKSNRVCDLDDCDRPHKAKGLCSTHDQQMRVFGEIRPLKIADWKLRPDGYVAKESTTNGKGWRIFQHRWVMEQCLGRELLPNETVHHVNGDRSDNRVENLELWMTSQPSGQRVSDRIRDALRVIETYGSNPEEYEQ